MQVEEHNVISISYELREGGAKGELLERMDAKYPFYFLFGTGKLLPAFEENLRGLKSGDRFEFILHPEEAYGDSLTGNIIDIPMAAFKVEGGEIHENILVEGNFVALTDDQGETHHGKILTYNSESVKVDFNHVMAGKVLYFKGVVLDVRKATVDELIRKHYIQEDGIHRPEEGYEEW